MHDPAIGTGASSIHRRGAQCYLGPVYTTDNHGPPVDKRTRKGGSFVWLCMALMSVRTRGQVLESDPCFDPTRRDWLVRRSTARQERLHRQCKVELLREDARGPPEARSYGVPVPALARPPPPPAAKKLLMMYFRNWHPFFPFLHGPTFFEAADKFYQKGQSLDGG